MVEHVERIVVRDARLEDCEQIAALADGLRRVLADPTGNLTAAAIARDGFGDNAEFSVVVADTGSFLAGYALFLDAYEPAYAARGVYLADLYVTDEMRGQGIGRQLISAVAADAQRRRRSYVWWAVLETNTTALEFYRRLKPTFKHSVVSHALVLSEPGR
jgi:ribosomal protein S18 acetylase RimI-like enzyme